MVTLRVGAVSYLNTKPLVRHLEQLAPQIKLSLQTPSQLADELRARRLDIALIPSIEYFRHGGYTILPGVSIASFGPVLSVRLCSRVPIAQIGSLDLDEGSRSSIALADILLSCRYAVRPRTAPLPLDRDPRQSTADAVLLIGDRAIRMREGSYPHTLDLGEEWTRWTGLPFVFAFWAVRPGVAVPPDVAQAFVTAKDHGRRDVVAIARHEAPRLAIDEGRCRHYLEQVIRHELGPKEWQGLKRFYQLAVECGLAPQGVECVLHRPQDLVQSS